VVTEASTHSSEIHLELGGNKKIGPLRNRANDVSKSGPGLPEFSWYNRKNIPYDHKIYQMVIKIQNGHNKIQYGHKKYNMVIKIQYGHKICILNGHKNTK
jgi:hypothetical protein